MNTYQYTITVHCETKEQADTVVDERLQPDEDYGFYYQLTYERSTT